MTTSVIETTTTGNADLKLLLAEIDELPSIPETLIRILKVLDDPETGPADLAGVVRQDAPLMAKILRLANSPYYSSRGGLTDINRCVAVLGYRTVRQVAICITVASSLVSAVKQTGGRLDYRELWRHSVVTGAIAKHLARMVKHPDPEEIFTAGLLHDMGKFALEIYAPQRYAEVIRGRHENRSRLIEAEQASFGFDHAQLGSVFAETWRFPEILIRSFGDHHIEMSGDPAREPQEMATAIVALADYLANTVEPARSDLGFDPRHVDAARLHARADIPVKLVEENMDDLRDSISKASAFLVLQD